MQDRWEQIKLLWRQYRFLYVIAGFIVGLLTFPALQLVINDLNDLLQSLVPEALGITFTVLLIDRLYAIRDIERQERELKARLISELSLNTNVFAKKAASLLWRKGWLQDGSLRNADLEAAHLETAYLVDADFSGSDCHYANFANANMRRANLSLANLRSVNFKGTDLKEACLEHATIFPDTEFDEKTILPDGTNWNIHTDMSRFTDPEHIDFWQPGNQHSNTERVNL